ncbi:hypothetical protein Tco_1219632 [Tanacetum coccineum]
MAGSDDDIPPPPPPLQTQTPTQQAPHTVSTIKLPILKKEEYDIWAMKMKHYLAHTDYPIWEVIQRGNGHVSVSTDTDGVIKSLLSTRDSWCIGVPLKMQISAISLGPRPSHGLKISLNQREPSIRDLRGISVSTQERMMDTLGPVTSEECKITIFEWLTTISGSDTIIRNSSGNLLQALKKVEAQLVAHQQNQLWYEEKIRFMKIDLDDKTDVLTYHKKL